MLRTSWKNRSPGSTSVEAGAFVLCTTTLVGTWMQMVAQAWLVLEITGSATWVGLTFAAQTLPILLVGPYGGLVADRTDKRRLLVALQAVEEGGFFKRLWHSLLMWWDSV